MHSELRILKLYSHQLLADPGTPGPSSILSKVAKECERLKGFLFLIFTKPDEHFHVEDVINWYRRATIQLADSLWEASKSGDPLISEVLALVVDFIRHFETTYPDLLEQRHALSLFEADELHKKIAAELSQIQGGLVQKEISIRLIEQLLKAYSDLFIPGRYPALSYADKKHAEIFLPRLKSLAVDERQKNWNLRFREVLIKYNVNHLGIYELMKSEGNNDAAFLNHYGEKRAYLIDRENWLDDLEPKPGLAYDSSVGSLKKLLKKHVRALHAKMSLMEEKTDQSRFNPNLSMRELNLIFKYLYQIGLPAYGTKQEAAASFCQHITSKEMKELSVKSILKNDMTDKDNTAQSLYKVLKKISDQLKADFNL